MALFCYGRLCGKSMLSAVGKVPTKLGTAQYAQAAAGAPKIMYKPYEPLRPEPYDDKNARLHRPMSPHLTIYQPQLTSMLSITHRISGMILSGYAAILGVGALALPNDISHYVTMLEGASPATLLLLKAMIAAPFAYHTVNGIRHLYWDTGKGLTIKEVYATGYAMLAASLVLTIALAAL